MRKDWRRPLRAAALGCAAVGTLAVASTPPVAATGAAPAAAGDRYPARDLRPVSPVLLGVLDRGPAPDLLVLPPAVLATGAVAPTPVPAVDVARLSSEGIPPLVLQAYRSAADRQAAVAPRCGLAWPLLAAIGRVESDHGRDVAPGGGITADGTVLPAIEGPVLDGSAGTAAISDGHGGWARAVGPMQFLTSTWASVGVDGNGDGRADPSNVFDATLGAARYLCAGGRDLRDPAGLSAAVLSYNHSDAYVRLVLQIMAQYAGSDPGALLTGPVLAPVSPAVTAAAPAVPGPAAPAPSPTRPPTAPPTSPPPPTPPTTPPTSPPAPLAQTLLFPVPGPLAWPGTPAVLAASGGGSGQPVTYTARPARTCRVTGASLAPTGPGTCTVTAAQAGAPGFLPAAPVSVAVPVGYVVTVLTDLTRPVPIGPPLPLELTLPDRPGSPPTVTATAVDGTALPAGEGLFVRRDDGTWRWSFPTRGLTRGAHVLDLTITGDPVVHLVTVRLR